MNDEDIALRQTVSVASAGCVGHACLGNGTVVAIEPRLWRRWCGGWAEAVGSSWRVNGVKSGGGQTVERGTTVAPASWS